MYSTENQALMFSRAADDPDLRRILSAYLMLDRWHRSALAEAAERLVGIAAVSVTVQIDRLRSPPPS